MTAAIRSSAPAGSGGAVRREDLLDGGDGALPSARAAPAGGAAPGVVGLAQHEPRHVSSPRAQELPRLAGLEEVAAGTDLGDHVRP